MSFDDTIPDIWCLMSVILASWRFAMVWDEDFDPKIRTFWVFEGGGKENGAWSIDRWVLYENSNSALLKMRIGILGMAAGRECFVLGEEQKSYNFWSRSDLIVTKSGPTSSISTPICILFAFNNISTKNLIHYY